MKTIGLIVTFSLFIGLPAGAGGLIPGPGEPGFDAALETKAYRYDRQFHTFNATPFGLSLDAYIPDNNHRDLVTQFLAQDAEGDFLAFTTALGTPLGPDDVVTRRDEHGDLGMFAGVAAIGDAYRYMVLRDMGADASLVAAARQDLLDAIDSFHVAGTIVGVPGTCARGVKLKSEPDQPVTEPVPATPCPPAGTRNNIWREDGSGLYPQWVYVDGNSKDQMLGYVMALGAFWDAAAGDPDIDQAVRDQIQEDARLLGQALMTPVEVAPGEFVDLVITDWHNCPTKHHDLNPRLIPRTDDYPTVLAEDATNQNGWGAMVSLGIIRTLYHISGDEDIRTFYYDELVARRDFPTLMITGPARVKGMYINICIAGNCWSTNFSNVNMAWVGAYGLLRYETDPGLRDAYQAMLFDELWDTGRPHDGLAIQQAFFNVMYSGFAAGGNDASATANAIDQLNQWMDPPYYNPVIENCDAAELAAGTCIGIDGTTVITIDDVPARGGGVAAEDPVPMSIRPPSNFEWRSDPRSVNGGGGIRLNPGGDFRSAYWMGRLLQVSSNGDDNISEVARNRDGTGGPDGGTDGGQDEEPVTEDGGEDGGEDAADAGTDAADGPDGTDQDTGDDASVTTDEPDPGDEPQLPDEGQEPTPQDDGGTPGDEVDDKDPGGCGCASSSTAHFSGLIALFALPLLRRSVRRQNAKC
jgi:hypothetical protein